MIASHLEQIYIYIENPNQNYFKVKNTPATESLKVEILKQKKSKQVHHSYTGNLPKKNLDNKQNLNTIIRRLNGCSLKLFLF